METTIVKPNATKVATKWALIYTAAAIVITYALQFLNIDQDSGWKYISFLFFIGFLVLTQKEFRDELGGYISYGDAFSAGMRYSIFAGLLVAVFTYLYYSILSPQMFDKMLDVIQQKMAAQNAPDNVVEKTMSIYRSWGKVIFPFFAAIGSAVI